MKHGKQEKIYLALILLMVAAIIGVTIFAIVRPKPEKAAAVPTLPAEHDTRVVVREVEKLVEVDKVITGDIIQDGLNDMGVLVTKEYYFTEVVGFSSVKKLFSFDLPLTESTYLASYDGVVTAGIDFGRITAQIDEAAKVIDVYIPRSTIQNIDVDPNSFVLHNEKISIANPLSAADFNRSLVELENTAAKKARERGILEAADENAKTVVANFIGSLVDTGTYELQFTSI